MAPKKIYEYLKHQKSVQSDIGSMVHNKETDMGEVQMDINSLQLWCEKWFMSLHPDKCTVVCYGLSTLAALNIR